MSAPHATVRDERGAAAVEFALVVPFLLLLLFGIISFGLMLTLRQSISQAAAEGARAAAVTLQANLTTDLASALPVGASTNPRVLAAQASVNDALSANGVTCLAGQLRRDGKDVGTCTVSSALPCVNALTQQCITVTLTYDYAKNPLVPTVPGLGLVLPDKLSYSAVSRVS